MQAGYRQQHIELVQAGCNEPLVASDHCHLPGVQLLDCQRPITGQPSDTLLQQLLQVGIGQIGRTAPAQQLCRTSLRLAQRVC